LASTGREMLLSQKKRGRGVLPELIQVVLSIPPRHFARTTPCAPFSKTEVNSSLIPKIVLVKVVETSQRRAPNPCKKVVQLYGPQPYGLVQFDVQRAAKPHREAHP